MEIRENGHVAYYRLTDPWETSDLTALYPQDIRFRDSVNHLVHTFMNVSSVRRVPSNVMRARLGAPAFIHPNSGQLIMVGAQSFPKTVAQTIFRVAHYDRAKFFDTEEEGWNYLRQFINAELVLAH
jgi:hypothetical protein